MPNNRLLEHIKEHKIESVCFSDQGVWFTRASNICPGKNVSNMISRGSHFVFVQGKQLNVWDIKTETLQYTIPVDAEVTCFLNDPYCTDSLILGLANSKIVFCNTSEGKIRQTVDAYVSKAVSQLSALARNAFIAKIGENIIGYFYDSTLSSWKSQYIHNIDEKDFITSDRERYFMVYRSNKGMIYDRFCDHNENGITPLGNSAKPYSVLKSTPTFAQPLTLSNWYFALGFANEVRVFNARNHEYFFSYRYEKPVKSLTSLGHNLFAVTTEDAIQLSILSADLYEGKNQKEHMSKLEMDEFKQLSFLGNASELKEGIRTLASYFSYANGNGTVKLSCYYALQNQAEIDALLTAILASKDVRSVYFNNAQLDNDNIQQLLELMHDRADIKFNLPKLVKQQLSMKLAYEQQLKLKNDEIHLLQQAAAEKCLTEEKIAKIEQMQQEQINGANKYKEEIAQLTQQLNLLQNQLKASDATLNVLDTTLNLAQEAQQQEKTQLAANLKQFVAEQEQFKQELEQLKSEYALVNQHYIAAAQLVKAASPSFFNSTKANSTAANIEDTVDEEDQDYEFVNI